MKEFDVVLLTESRYENPRVLTEYISNVLKEDQLVTSALQKHGLKTARMDWAGDFDWSQTKYVLFRSTWDYFYKIDAFSAWLEKASAQTKMINPYSLIRWNMDKHYLQDLERKGVNITPTLFIEPGTDTTLADLFRETGWHDAVLKPAISGGGRHTYKLHTGNLQEHENIFRELIAGETMLLQPFQHNVVKQGEFAFMAINGQLTHAVLKVARPGDFRVQDDFGGTVHPHIPGKEQATFVQEVLAACDTLPVYARVDVIFDNDDQLALSEIELIEPEMWFRYYPPAADKMAEAIAGKLMVNS